jgi:hypothetical protein
VSNPVPLDNALIAGQAKSTYLNLIDLRDMLSYSDNHQPAALVDQWVQGIWLHFGEQIQNESVRRHPR